MIRQITPTLAVILFFFVSLFLYTKLTGPLPFQVNSVTTTKTDTFNVTGEGKVNITPDIAVLNVGVSTESTTVKGAQDQMNSIINKVTDSVKKLGVSDKDIQTSGYNINPNYDFSSGSQRITGYSASTTLIIKVKDLNKINQVIDSATTNGANQINSLSFDIADKEGAENEARKKAVEVAKKKAQTAASTGGFSLGQLVNYSESTNQPPILYPRGGTEASLDVSKATEVQPGSLEVTISVTISYQII